MRGIIDCVNFAHFFTITDARNRLKSILSKKLYDIYSIYVHCNTEIKVKRIISSLCVCVGGFPTQVVVCDLRQERTMRATVLIGGGDMWDCALCRPTTELARFTLWALGLAAIQILKFAKGDRFPRDAFRDYSRRTEVHASNLISHAWIVSIQVLFTLFFFLLGLSWGGGKWNITVRVEMEAWPSSRLGSVITLYCSAYSASNPLPFQNKKQKNNISYTAEICRTIFDGIYFKKPIDKGLLF